MSVNIQQADKTLKKVADTTVVNKSTVIGALKYTPASTDQLNTAKTELTNSINTAKTDLTNSIGEVSSNLSTTATNLQQQIDALEGSSFDGDYNKLTNAPILNDEDGTATFADEAGNIIARIDNSGLETTNLNLHGDIELADQKLEIIDETGNIVLRIDDNGVETKATNELKTQVANINTELPTKAPINSPTFTGTPKAPSPIDNSSQRVATTDYVENAVAGLQENIGDVFDFNDDGALTLADPEGRKIAEFDGAGLRVTNVTIGGESKPIDVTVKLSNIDTALNSKMDKVSTAIENNLASFTSGGQVKDTGVVITQAIANNVTSIPTGKAVTDYVADYDINTIQKTYATKEALNTTVKDIDTKLDAKLDKETVDHIDFSGDNFILANENGIKIAQIDEDGLTIPKIRVLNVSNEGPENYDVTQRFKDIETNKINKTDTYTKSEVDAIIENVNTNWIEADAGKMNAASNATVDHIVTFTDTHNVKDSGKVIITSITNSENIPTDKAVKTYVDAEILDYNTSTIVPTYATKTELANKATELSGATAAVATDLEEHITETDGRGKLHITTAERTAWDAAKDYNNLENKPIEQDGNDKEFIITYNDENHIMARINDTGLRVLDVEIGPEGSSTTLSTKFSNIDTELSNRYTETETDQKIAEAIANAEHLKREIVDTLPTTNIDPRVIYMVKAKTAEESTQDLYDEYMYINNAWERLGSWQTDLSGYAKTDNVNTQFNALNFYKTVKVGSASIEAKGNDDTLTLVAGSNVMLGVDTENNTITIGSVDTNLDGVDILGNGNAVTSGSYNTKTNKVVLIKGETFATKTEHDNHVTNYNTFKDDFDSKFNLNLSEGSLEIVDDPEKTGSNTQNILARFDSEGLTTVGATFINPITVGEPEADTDAATKKYVDEVIANNASSGIYIQATEPTNPKDGDLWVDTDDEEQTVLATVAASGSFNDLTDKPTYGIADITNLQTELDKLATQAWVQQQIAAIAIYDGSVS